MKFPLDHDLHLHSVQSLCCRDPEMTPAHILQYGQAHGYRTLCLTDHVWSKNVPMPAPNDFYVPQTVGHIRESLPLPQADGAPRFLFGAETDFCQCGGEALGLTRAECDALDFVVIPINHFHMTGFTRPADCASPEQIAELLTHRLERLLDFDLPWTKVGLAHFTCGLTYPNGDEYEVFDRLDRTRVFRAFSELARRGAGIELNAGCFLHWRDDPERHLWPYRLAKDAGCRFYCASDAHMVRALDAIPILLPDVVDELGLTEQDLFLLP